MGHKREWKQYHRQLVNRGKINFWIAPEIFKNWNASKEEKAYRPLLYGDELIRTVCDIRFKFHLSLRETEGFFVSLIALMKEIVKVPCYTQLCRRMKQLAFSSKLLAKRNVTDVVLDATGLKVYGAGEWRTEKYGGKKRGKKLHLGLDPESGKLLLAELTDEHVHDTTYLETALKRSNRKKGKVLIDGIADTRRCYCLTKR